MSHIDLQPAIICGGSLTRLWPLSRAGFPKQFLVLTGNQSLFRQAPCAASMQGSENLLASDGTRSNAQAVDSLRSRHVRRPLDAMRRCATGAKTFSSTHLPGEGRGSFPALGDRALLSPSDT